METKISEKILCLEALFRGFSSSEEKYRYLIELGGSLIPYPKEWKTEEKRVLGCQSLMYLHTEHENNKIFYFATSDALISRGLAALLISIYSGEEPKTILMTPPTFLQSLGILGLLSPNRSHGLLALHQKMMQQILLKTSY